MKASKLLLLFIISIFSEIYSQDVYGILDNKIISIEKNTGNLITVTSLSPSQGENITGFIFIKEECSFYAVADFNSEPELIQFSDNGVVRRIGKLTIPNGRIFLLESLIYDEETKIIYASVSLNGGVNSNDFESESIVIVNKTNAICTFVSEITPNGIAKPDIDNMTIIGDSIFIHDGQTATNKSVFLTLPKSNLEPISVPTFRFETNYIPISAMIFDGTKLYFTDANRNFQEIKLNNNQISRIAQTHTSSQFNSRSIRGLTIKSNNNYNFFPKDTTICEELKPLALKIPIENVTVKWNNDSIGSILQVDKAGKYWAEISLANCKSNTDTINIEFIVCDSCKLIENQYKQNLILGQDQTICKGDSILLSLGIGNMDSILWNNGETSEQISIKVPGTFSATISINDCQLFTDSVTISVSECTPCQYYIPNIFSPNGDGKNETFGVFFSPNNCSISEIIISIFDKWGNLLYSGSNGEWDGQANNTWLNPGVYVYIVEIIFNEGDVIIESGSVTIVH